MSAILDDAESEELKEWLTQNEVTSIRWSRDFQDAVLCAQLLKRFYPRLIEFHNYPLHSSLKAKLANWETLNAKVFAKLNIVQPRHVLEHLARGTSGYIETLLFQIMNYVKAYHPMYRTKHELGDENVVVMTMMKKIGDRMVPTARKMVVYSLYEETANKIQHLENSVKEQSELCEELSKELETVVTRYKCMLCEQGKDTEEEAEMEEESVSDQGLLTA